MTLLIAFLDQHGASYRLIDHEPEGRTEIVSPLRGNALSQATKCIVLMVKSNRLGKHLLCYTMRGLDMVRHAFLFSHMILLAHERKPEQGDHRGSPLWMLMGLFLD